LPNYQIELHNEFKEVLESLETERIELIIKQVAAYDPQLQETLSQLTNNFNFSVILKVLG
jgi:hypothetical protein